MNDVTSLNSRSGELQSSIADFVNRLQAKRSGNGWKARCPAHEDRTPSLSISEGEDGRVLIHCHAGCTTDQVLAALGLSKADLFPAKYPWQSGNGARSTPAFAWQRYNEAFTDQDVERVAKWRGFAPEFVKELRDSGFIGIYENCVGFPVHSDGKVVGTHFRLKDGNWNYAPKGIKAAPLVFGDLTPGEPVQCFESTFDGLDYMDKSGEREGIVITRGAANAKFAELVPTNCTLYVWTQNDNAGRSWEQKICSYTKCCVKRVKIPAPHKDLNDWTKAGASDQELWNAMVNAETIQEAPRSALSPEQLFQTIKSFVTRYVVFSRPEHVDVITLWIMHTWLADSADFTPYIYLHSPVMRCGKTQVHRVVEPLVQNPLRTCNVSDAALYREIEESHPTLLWDEIDSIFGNRKSSEANENKRALLNAGYERGMTAIRMERGPGGFVKISFDPFCPKILAGIGRLPDTIVDRSIPILIHRRLKTQSCQKFRRVDRASAKPLHDALQTWSSNAELQKRLREAHPHMPESLTDRQEDIWEPLSAIADSIGGDVPRLAREAACSLLGNDEEDSLAHDTAQLAAIRKIVGERGRITSADLIDGLWEYEALPPRLMEGETPNYKKIGHWLSKFIKSYGGKPARQLDFDGQNARGYEAAELKEIFERYCPPK